MDRDNLFLETLNDLEKKLNSSTNYDILKSAGLLRLLLLDKPSLLGLAQKGRMRGIKFTIANTKPIKGVDAWFLLDGLDPLDAPPNVQSIEVSLPDLLSTEVIRINNVDLTVKDVIRYVSHILGGVHAGTPEEEADLVLSQIDSEFQIGTGNATVYSLRAIIRVVVTALQPLREMISHKFDT